MSVSINFKDTHKLKFKNLEIGDVFIYDNELFMKTDAIDWNTINLQTGMMIKFEDTLPIEDVNIEINVYSK